MTAPPRTIEVEPVDGGFAVRVDAKPLMTPALRALVLPTRALADAVAAEWAVQGREVRPHTMPMTQFAVTTLDRIAVQRSAVADAVAAYAETDLLCYRAESPRELAERQAKVWQPLLDWAALRYDAALQIQTGLMPRPQPADAVNALRRVAAALDDHRLSALQFACGVLGSLVLALALLDRRIDVEEAFVAAELDASWQIERWGEDAEATARRAVLRTDIAAVRRFVDLLDG